ncbi:cache domain-containing protein [Methanococcoides orientis]|uniref:cache domain-containing protein n=1 Tax=Methanococcoides orientis TaxID=2822137 RepID=UPI001E58DD5D|nr:cache domain-containing protein [Methanococcoides orientis]UGV41507.1 cache domain-containing protein [Methanococcoides orientis]
MRTYNILLVITLVLMAILGAGCMDANPEPSQNQSEASLTGTLSPDLSSTASPEELIAFVENAYEYANVQGQEAALREFNNRTGQFVDGELYIFAYDIDGTTLALPFQPEVIGTDRWNITDANGTAYIQEMAATAQSNGSFFRYLYVDPADNFTVKQKLSYVMMVDEEWFLGAGIYDSQAV